MGHTSQVVAGNGAESTTEDESAIAIRARARDFENMVENESVCLYKKAKGDNQVE